MKKVKRRQKELLLEAQRRIVELEITEEFLRSTIVRLNFIIHTMDAKRIGEQGETE
jgi:uncharacterized coiled-coil protein SlyX